MNNFEKIERALLEEKDAMLAYNLLTQKCTQMRNVGLTELADQFNPLVVKLAEKATASGRKAQLAGLLLDKDIQEAYEQLKRDQAQNV